MLARNPDMRPGDIRHGTDFETGYRTGVTDPMHVSDSGFYDHKRRNPTRWAHAHGRQTITEMGPREGIAYGPQSSPTQSSSSLADSTFDYSGKNNNIFNGQMLVKSDQMALSSPGMVGLRSSSGLTPSAYPASPLTSMGDMSNPI
jgi:hypothetical protein